MKFRAWDKGKKEWLETSGIDFSDAAPNGFWIWGLEVYPNPEDCILTQYTGLHDKDGKEIFEGDIVRGELWGHAWNLPVQFSGRGIEPFCGIIKDGICLSSDDCKIIGNIYEHQHLIGRK
jgi:uncharacterized phage protein (TIGR01671 family)